MVFGANASAGNQAGAPLGRALVPGAERGSLRAWSGEGGREGSLVWCPAE